MAFYDKTLGRVRVVVNENGAKDHGYGHGAGICCRDGWNDSSSMVTHTMSIEELRDLRYLLDRAITLAEEVSR